MVHIALRYKKCRQFSSCIALAVMRHCEVSDLQAESNYIANAEPKIRKGNSPLTGHGEKFAALPILQLAGRTKCSTFTDGSPSTLTRDMAGFPNRLGVGGRSTDFKPMFLEANMPAKACWFDKHVLASSVDRVSLIFKCLPRFRAVL